MTTTLPPWLEEHCLRLQAKNSDIINLNLNIRRLDESMMEALAKALRNNHVIEIVNLTSALIQPEQALLPLAQVVLPNHPSLQTIHLSYNRLENVTALGLALQTNKSLLELYLDYNLINTSSAVALARGIAQNNTLQVLQLNFNRIGDQGGRALGNALQSNKSLRQLGLKKNILGPDSASVFMEVLLENVTLTRLNLDENSNFPASAFQKVQYYIRSNQVGRYLLRDRFLPAGLWSLTLEGLEPTMMFFFLKRKPDLIPRNINHECLAKKRHHF